MRLTESSLRRIIREEVERIVELEEAEAGVPDAPDLARGVDTKAVAKTISQLRDWELELSKLSDEELKTAVVPYIVDWITGEEGITDFGDVKPKWVAEKLVDPVVNSLRGM